MNSLKTICGVYRITNPIGEVYIGCSNNIFKRISCHKSRVKRAKYNSKLYQSLRMYGYENHLIDVVEECEERYLLDKELDHINKSLKIGTNILNTHRLGFDRSKYRREYYLSVEKPNKNMFSEFKFITLDIQTGVYYYSVEDTMNRLNFSKSKVIHIFNGRTPNNTSLIKC